MNSKTNTSESVVLTALKARYFSIIRSEDFPRTPKVTSELDELEREIRKFDASSAQAA